MKRINYHANSELVRGGGDGKRKENETIVPFVVHCISSFHPQNSLDITTSKSHSCKLDTLEALHAHGVGDPTALLSRNVRMEIK